MKRIIGVALSAAFLFTEGAHACAVCWGGASDSSMIDGAKMSILFMAVLIYSVLAAFIAGIVVIGRRSRQAAVIAADPGQDQRG